MRADQSRQTYLWTLFRPHVEPTTSFGHLCEVAGWLDSKRLPGITPPDWIVDVHLEENEIGNFQFIHDTGGAQEWKIVIAPVPRL